MEKTDVISKYNAILEDYTPEEIEERLNDIFEGYLGADTGAMPGELQQNHHLIHQIIGLFK